MFVRIASFEGGDLSDADQAIERVKQMSGEARPPGLEGAKRHMMLVDRKNARGLGLVFFDTEEDMRKGDEALNAMSPGSRSGQRTSVDMYEVGIDREF